MPTSNITKKDVAIAATTNEGTGWSYLDLAGALLVLVAILLAGWPVANPPLILDDLTQVQYVEELSGFELLLAPDSLGLFRPAKNWLFAIFANGEQSGNLVWSFAGLAFHASCALLLAVLARRLGFGQLLGWMVALLWAMSPAAASVFAFYSAQNIALSTAGVLGFILLADWAEEKRGNKQYTTLIIVALACLALALAAYELAVTAPLILATVLAYRRRFALKQLNWQVPLIGLGMVAVYLVLRVIYQGAWSGNIPTFPPDTPRWAIALSAPRYLWWHIAAQFEMVPYGVVLTDNPLRHTAENLVCWLALAVLVILAWRARGNMPLFSLGIAAALLSAGPLMNFVPLGNGPLAAYYCYLPGMGIVVALAAVLHGLILRNKKLGAQASLIATQMLAVIAIGLGLTLKGRVTLCSKPELMHMQTVAAYPDAYISVAALLHTLTVNGQYNEAENLWKHLESIAPWYASGRIRAMQLYEAMGRPDVALTILENSPPEAEENHRLVYQRGLLYERSGMPQKAAKDYRHIISEMPFHPEVTFAATNSFAILMANLKQYSEATQLFQKALELDPNNELVQQNLKLAQALALQAETVAQ